jgi:hypothetical protein
MLALMLVSLRGSASRARRVRPKGLWFPLKVRLAVDHCAALIPTSVVRLIRKLHKWSQFAD